MYTEDLKNLLIGIIGTLIVTWGSKFFKNQHRKSLEDDISLIDLELKALENMKRSSIEMSRVSFRGLYTLLFLFGLANIITLVFDWLGYPSLVHLRYILLVVIWFLFTTTALMWWKRYDNLKNYADAVKRLENKKAKKEAYLQRLGKYLVSSLKCNAQR
ncbi:membrane protein [Vibrio cholerae]|uniref:hypothetical protein n=2 Tax=Vibrio cholerae TaxID=666 RepID=UPI0011D314F8|nr:hypothetical protein [Vibrio cholerae]TXY97433.1 hypothetical protein FXE68_05955 [Vibrio cholerae]GHZ35620.1 membrane protein [Vibrio cholerae]GIB39278.1 membrane protein [Vibrio cholerae]